MSQDVLKTLDKVTLDTQKALGDNLVSLILYGSHARQDASETSDINLFLVVRDSHASKLEPLLKLVPSWMKHRVTPPVVFEQEQLSRSLDTFALEFLEIAAARKVLAGEDPFLDFAPDWQAVRRELEEEAREKTVALKRQWFAAGRDSKQMREIISATVPGYLSILRGTLHVQRRNMAPIPTRDVIEGVRHWPGFDPGVWQRLWETAKKTRTPAASEMTQLMNDYLEQARLLVRHIDALLKDERAA